LATAGHAILFSERCTGTLWAAFLMQGTQSHYIHFTCKFGDMNTNKPDSCLSAVIHNSLFQVWFTPLLGKSTCRLYVITCFFYTARWRGLKDMMLWGQLSRFWNGMPLDCCVWRYRHSLKYYTDCDTGINYIHNSLAVFCGLCWSPQKHLSSKPAFIYAGRYNPAGTHCPTSCCTWRIYYLIRLLTYDEGLRISDFDRRFFILLHLIN
jgi:hypothetical protein